MELEIQAQEGKKKDQEKNKEKEKEKTENKKKKKEKEEKTKGGVRKGPSARPSGRAAGAAKSEEAPAGRLVCVGFGVRAGDGRRRGSQGQGRFSSRKLMRH